MQAITEAIRRKDPRKILYTIEFFPEEGKYHYDGHRNCKVLFSPKETRKHKSICPVCGKRLTVGVMNRVEELADRPEGYVPAKAIPAFERFPWMRSSPMPLGWETNASSVEKEYLRLVEKGESEFNILLELSPEELSSFTPPMILEGILRVREGRLKIIPGHDGVFREDRDLLPRGTGKGNDQGRTQADGTFLIPPRWSSLPERNPSF